MGWEGGGWGKTNRDSLTPVFPNFSPANFDWFLYDTHLKIALCSNCMQWSPDYFCSHRASHLNPLLAFQSETG